MTAIYYVWWTCFWKHSEFLWVSTVSSSRRLVPLFLWTRLHEEDSQQQQQRKEASTSYNFKFRYTDDVLSLNIPTLSDYVDLIWPIGLIYIKDTTDTTRSASYLDIHIEIDWEIMSFSYCERSIYMQQRSSSTCI